LTRVSSFSDLILRATFLKPKDHVLTYLQGELMALGRMQTNLIARHNILVRGGVSYGDLYMARETVFGPALVRSYELAEQTAIFPRIVIDPSLAVRFAALRNSGQCARGEDGTYFIDYLHHQQFILDRSIKAFDQIVRQHKQAIEERLSERNNSERVRQKITWLALYHNSVVNRTDSDKLNPSPLSYLIPEHLYLHTAEPPSAQ
jgi:hypothetical protein